MKNLINFFFSFDKLFKEKLVVPFFWLALIVLGLYFFEEALELLSLAPLASFAGFIGFFVKLLLALIAIRIVSEVCVAIFRINDNLSPDGGKSELADIDPVGEARKAAELAASRTREMTKTATDKAISATSTKSVEATPVEKTMAVTAKGSDSKVSDKPTLVKASEASENDGQVTKARGRGRPKGSTNKAKPAAAKVAPTLDPVTGEPVKRGRGRPKGSTNKSKSAAAKPAATKTPVVLDPVTGEPVKRGRGRPKGSTNKSKSASAKAKAPTPIDPVTGEPVKRGRGRPKGSTNKSKSAAAKPAPKLDPITGEPIKSRRGRPKGAKNKPKAASADGNKTNVKPGPKPGMKVRRDADGNLLKKDGTPRKKPGPKT